MGICYDYNEEFAGDDIFVHWNSLKVEEEQYRYLLNDEPVQFTISWNKDAKHPYQATDVTGVSGKLMCERRNENLNRVLAVKLLAKMAKLVTNAYLVVVVVLVLLVVARDNVLVAPLTTMKTATNG